MSAPHNPQPENSRPRVSLKEPALIAIETLRSHKLRSFLTLLGVILSVSTLIIVVSMVEGTNRYVADKVANFGSNVFLVMRFPLITSQEQFVKLQRTNKDVTWDDYEYVRDNMTLAQEVGLEVRRNGTVKYKTQTIEDINVRGVTANIGEIDVEEPAIGRYIVDSDNEHRSNVTMIGSNVAKRFFEGLDPLGKVIYIDGEAYEVVGVAKEQGSTFGQSQDDFVYIPIETWRKVYGSNVSMNINVKALSPDLMQPAEDEARMLMRARRHLSPKQDDTFGILEPSALLELWSTLTGSLARGSIGVVFIFLVIGGIVIMNIMLASVTERTREIGVRKSLGATRRDVLLQFLVESAVMAAIGGVLGVIVAGVLAFAISHLTPVPVELPVRWVFIAVIIATAVGVFFGVYPAHKAAKLDPIEALRFET
ncbi:MAG TPA: ABC transporter permease [Candidatus Limnocylindrales bacterium]|nr:ABC transporter permease [Candidatus Limnocylindrales bacterium]